jgi:hypothetical protein
LLILLPFALSFRQSNFDPPSAVSFPLIVPPARRVCSFGREDLFLIQRAVCEEVRGFAGATLPPVAKFAFSFL